MRRRNEPKPCPDGMKMSSRPTGPGSSDKQISPRNRFPKRSEIEEPEIEENSLLIYIVNILFLIALIIMGGACDIPPTKLFPCVRSEAERPSLVITALLLVHLFWRFFGPMLRQNFGLNEPTQTPHSLPVILARGMLIIIDRLHPPKLPTGTLFLSVILALFWLGSLRWYPLSLLISEPTPRFVSLKVEGHAKPYQDEDWIEMDEGRPANVTPEISNGDKASCVWSVESEGVISDGPKEEKCSIPYPLPNGLKVGTLKLKIKSFCGIDQPLATFNVKIKEEP